MLFPVRQTFRALTACVLVAVFAVPPSLLAQIHVVSRADLRTGTLAATQARQHNLGTVRQFLSSQGAQKVVKSAHMDPAQVKTAVSTLSDQELEQLASKADKVQSDAAGKLSDRDLLLIILGIAALALIVVAVQHHH